MKRLHVAIVAVLALALSSAALAHDPYPPMPTMRVETVVDDPYLNTPRAIGHVAAAYVSPTGDGSFFDAGTLEADSGFGVSLGWEWRWGHWLGLDLNALYSEHDIDAKGYGTIGDTMFLPLTAALNFHLTAETCPVDLYIGPLFGYTFYDDVDAKVDGSRVSVDASTSFTWGAQLGLQVPAPKRGWAFYANVKYLDTDYAGDVRVDGEKLGKLTVDVNPWVGELGIAFRY